MRVRTAVAGVVLGVGASVVSAGPTYTGRVLYSMGANRPAGLVEYATDESSSQAAAGGQVGGAGYGLLSDGMTLGLPQAVWWRADGSTVNLHPAQTGAVSSVVEGVFGNQQVGNGNSVNRSGNEHALLWTGSAGSVVDLNPTVFSYIDNSFAVATDGVHQVGNGYGDTTNGSVHALLWAGTAATAVDLSPTNLTGYEETFAYGVRGNQQVGLAFGTATSQNYHAMLWNGSAGSAVDLNPTNLGAIDTSLLSDTTGTRQVGAIAGDATGGNFHAAIWSGTAGSAVDLNPAGVVNSLVNGTNGPIQVGVRYDDPTAEVNHAMLWAGSAASAEDLEPLLPSSGAWEYSDAYTVDGAGTVYGTAYGTYGGVTDLFAVAWSPVPEPAAGVMMAAGLALAGRRGRCR